MPRPTRIGDEWESYVRNVLPKNIGTTQRWETRRAFYSGAASLHGIMMRSLSPDRDPTAEDLTVMEDMIAELMAFNERVKAGSA